MVKLILNKKYKTNNPGDVIEANKKLEEILVNKGMAHYAQMGGVVKLEDIPKPHDDGFILPPISGKEFIPDKKIISYDITDSFTEPKEKKPRKPRKPRKKKAEKFKW